MYLYDMYMVTNIDLRYANSSSNYEIIMMLQSLKKFQNREFRILFVFLRHEVQS